LLIASVKKLAFIVVMLVETGFDVNHTDHKGFSPLFAAICNCNLVSMESFLKFSGVNIFGKNISVCPLYTAATLSVSLMCSFVCCS